MKKKTPRGRLWAIIFVFLGGWSAGLLWRGLTAPPDLQSARLVRLNIAPNTPSSVVIAELKRQGVIRSEWAMRLALELRRQDLKAGTFDFSSDQSLGQIMQQLDRGVIATNQVTIPEGWTIEDMGAHFAKLGYFSSQSFREATTRASATTFPDWLPQEVETLEGFLFPDTYELPLQGTTPELVVQMMTDRFAEVALPAYKQGNKTNLSLKDWVTLSSIVEKEAVLSSERPTIAGVFWRRLQKNMRLEADPTVEYGLKIRQTPENPLTLDQVRTPNPFNTYLNPGLPPHPIGSPGLASLEASLAPPPTDYLFFVARYDGSHVFSRTLEEHEQAIAKIAKQFPP